MSGHTITVIGSGFAALTAVRELRKQGRRDRFKLVFFNPAPRAAW